MTIALAFLGVVVSCLSPCVLPVLPVFTAYVSGAGRTVDMSGTVSADRGRQRAVGFLLGLGGVFVALWISLGLVGFALLSTVPILRPIAGLAIVALGLATIVGWKPQLPGGRFGGSGSFGGSFLLGAGVAVGWTPCIGPTLGAILTLAAASDSVWSGALLLVAYAAGMAVPFVAVAFGLSRSRSLARMLARHHRPLRVATGALIVGVGVLVVTNAFSRLAGLVPWVF